MYVVVPVESKRFCWVQVTEDFKETLGHQVFLDKRVNQEPLELDFQVQVVLKVRVSWTG